jgi:hypothetical protein
MSRHWMARTARSSTPTRRIPSSRSSPSGQNRDGSIERRAANSDMGGSDAPWRAPCEVVPGSLAHRVYGATTVAERHRHRYEVNNHYLPRLETAGLVVGARARSDTAGDLCEMIELPQHPWFFGCQFHPEFTSNPRRASALHRASCVPRSIGSAARRTAASATPSPSSLPDRPMKLCGFDVGLNRPLFLIAGPCVVESREFQIDVAGKLKEICAAVGHSVHLQVVLRQGEPQLRRFVSRPGMDEGLRILAEVKRQIACRC